MNKTININLGGVIFHLDETAYTKLTSYLKSISNKFAKDPGQAEIIADIEARIAEIFSSKLDKTKEVINMTDVDEVISIMGSPEDYETEDDDEEKTTNQTGSTGKQQYYNVGKRLYRDPDDRVLGGVSSGVAAYLGVDPAWLRIAWVVSTIFYGFGPLFYIILWIALPEARTTAQKLQMRGEPINISNIEKSVKDEFQKMGKTVNKVTNDPKFSNKIANTVDDLVKMFLSIIKFVLLLAFKLIGIALLIGGVFIIFAFITAILGHEVIINNNMLGWYDFNGFLNHIFVNEAQRSLFIAGIFMLATAPIILLFLLGVRILFNYRKESKYTFILVTLVSVAGAIMIIFSATSLIRDFKERGTYTSTIDIQQDGQNLFFLDINETLERIDENGEELFNWSVDENFQYRSAVTLTIAKSLDGKMVLKKKALANGKNKRTARLRAKNMHYMFEQRDSLLLFDDFFSISEPDKIRNQKIQLILYVPVGTTVYLDEDIIDVIYDIPNVTDTYDPDMLGHHWLMTQNGLICLDCGSESNHNFDELWDMEEKKMEIEDELEEIQEEQRRLRQRERALKKKEKALKEDQ